MVRITDSGVLFAKNSDRDPNEAQLIEWIPPHDHPVGTSVRCTWIEIPQAERTNGLLLSRPWWMWGAEMGANDQGVVIGNEAVFTRRVGGIRTLVGVAPDQDHPALLGMDLVRLALERSASASAAVDQIISLLEEFGQGGPCSHEHRAFTYDNSFMIADGLGAYVLETAGRSWECEEVPHGTARSLSNGLTIPSFARAHSDRFKTAVAQAGGRQRITGTAAAAAVGPLDLMAALRSHGGSSAPVYSAVNGSMSGPCMHAGGFLANSQTTSSWVSDMRGYPLHWVTATAAPCTSIFKPARVGDPVDLGKEPTNRFDSRSFWWQHERFHRVAMADYSAATARFAHDRNQLERLWVDEPPASADAFHQASGIVEQWRGDVVGAKLHETRPRWARGHWAKQDRKAGLANQGSRDA